MIHHVEAKTCPEAWLKATDYLLKQEDYTTHSMILDIETPVVMTLTDFRIFDQVDQFHSFRGRDLFFQEFTRHENWGQRVIEVVGDSPGKGADAFDPLGAEKLRLNQFLFGDIGVDNQD